MIFSRNYGVLEEGKNEDSDKNTLYAIASNTKAFTTAIIGMLVQEGKLDWMTRSKNTFPILNYTIPG